jgi:hypothetical protein
MMAMIQLTLPLGEVEEKIKENKTHKLPTLPFRKEQKIMPAGRLVGSGRVALLIKVLA